MHIALAGAGIAIAASATVLAPLGGWRTPRPGTNPTRLIAASRRVHCPAIPDAARIRQESSKNSASRPPHPTGKSGPRAATTQR
jgi:hypothetical protein